MCTTVADGLWPWFGGLISGWYGLGRLGLMLWRRWAERCGLVFLGRLELG